MTTRKSEGPKGLRGLAAAGGWRSRLATAAAAAALSGCAAPPGSNAPAASGSAGGATAVGADSKLQTCTEPVGTVRLQDDTASQAASTAQANPNLAGIQALLGGLASLGSLSGARGSAPAPAAGAGSVSMDSLRLLIQQSNCLLIVDRGMAETGTLDEKRRARTGNETSDDANMGPGQEMAADYVLRSRVVEMGTKESSGFSLGALSKIVGGASLNKAVTEAKVMLIMSDVRRNVQIAVAQGKGSGENTGLATTALGGKGGLGLLGLGYKSESNTSGTTVLLQAFADAYNNLVPAMQNYKQQSVRGGAGAGGTLKVQGSRANDAPVVQK